MSDHMNAATEESAKILAAIILAKGWDSSNEQTREAFRTDSTTMLEAALPELRAMIAQEIRADISKQGQPSSDGASYYQVGMTRAALIVEGPQQ